MRYLGSLLGCCLLVGCGGSGASVKTFARYWWGHDRGLDIKRDGRGHEVVNDGCCHTVVALRFRIADVQGQSRKAVATVKITAVEADRAVYVAGVHRLPPRVGQAGSLVLDRGVITDKLTTATFCANTVSTCGA